MVIVARRGSRLREVPLRPASHPARGLRSIRSSRATESEESFAYSVTPSASHPGVSSSTRIPFKKPRLSDAVCPAVSTRPGGRPSIRVHCTSLNSYRRRPMQIHNKTKSSRKAYRSIPSSCSSPVSPQSSRFKIVLSRRSACLSHRQAFSHLFQEPS